MLRNAGWVKHVFRTEKDRFFRNFQIPYHKTKGNNRRSSHHIAAKYGKFKQSQEAKIETNLGSSSKKICNYSFHNATTKHGNLLSGEMRTVNRHWMPPQVLSKVTKNVHQNKRKFSITAPYPSQLT